MKKKKKNEVKKIKKIENFKCIYILRNEKSRNNVSFYNKNKRQFEICMLSNF